MAAVQSCGDNREESDNKEEDNVCILFNFGCLVFVFKSYGIKIGV